VSLDEKEPYAFFLEYFIYARLVGAFGKPDTARLAAEMPFVILHRRL